MPANRFTNIDRHNDEKEPSTSGNENKRKKKIKPASKRSGGTFWGRMCGWCTACCRAHKRKKSALRKRRAGFWKRLKEKCKNCKRKARTRSKPSATSTVDFKELEGETSEKKHNERERHRRRARRSRISREMREKDPAETFVGSEDMLVVAQVAPPEFTKSCCYLCAQNSMAIAGAVSNKIEKSHISIQSSAQFIKETPMSDKGCSPAVYVRTVQSSVRVKMRDMSTSYPEGKKSKKPKYKFRIRKLIRNIKLPMHPKVRTVACETDKSARRNNVPQCKARRGTHCVTQRKK